MKIKHTVKYTYQTHIPKLEKHSGRADLNLGQYGITDTIHTPDGVFRITEI